MIFAIALIELETKRENGVRTTTGILDEWSGVLQVLFDAVSG